MPAQYQAPSAWASIGELADKVDDMHLRSVSPLELERLLTSMKTELKTHVVDKVSLVHQTTMFSKSSGLRTFVINVACSLGNRVSTLEPKGTTNPPSSDVRGQALTGSEDQDAEVETRLLNLETLMKGLLVNTLGESLMDGAETPSQVAERIKGRIESMELRIGKLFAKGDDLAIKFLGLGFTKPNDANS
jgi:hypothetical protein